VTSTLPQRQPTPSTPTKSTIKDEFPPLPGVTGRPQQPGISTSTAIPNAWNVKPQIPTDKPIPTTSSTAVPNAWNTKPIPTSTSTAVPNAWNTKPPSPTDKPATFFPSKAPSVVTTSTRRPQIHTQGSQNSESKVTDAELLTLSDSLFSKDIYNPFKFVTVNYQGRTQSSATTDEASQP
jgi:hypothetical protein